MTATERRACRSPTARRRSWTRPFRSAGRPGPTSRRRAGAFSPYVDINITAYAELCIGGATPFSLLPDFLSARLPGTLDELEAVVARAKRASSLLAAANALRTKTTVCRNVAATLQPGRYRVCYVSLTTGNVLDMYKSIGTAAFVPGMWCTYVRCDRFLQLSAGVVRTGGVMR